MHYNVNRKQPRKQIKKDLEMSFHRQGKMVLPIEMIAYNHDKEKKDGRGETPSQIRRNARYKK